MSYFNNFPYIYYEFAEDDIRLYKDISRRAIPVEEITKRYSNLETYVVKEGETPETIAAQIYGDVDLHWTILLVNNVMNVYTDWPLNERALLDSLREEFREQIDSDNNLVTLTDTEVEEFIFFEGLPQNDYRGTIETVNGGTVNIRPYGLQDPDGNIYAIDTYSTSLDARGRTIENPVTLTPVSQWDYRISLNEIKRQILVPNETTARKMNRELRDVMRD